MGGGEGGRERFLSSPCPSASLACLPNLSFSPLPLCSFCPLPLCPLPLCPLSERAVRVGTARQGVLVRKRRQTKVYQRRSRVTNRMRGAW